MAPWKKVILWVGAAIAALPVAMILTFVLWPFWDWFEATSGIESLGHSGPADWCFVAIYIIIGFVSVAIWWWSRRNRRA